MPRRRGHRGRRSQGQPGQGQVNAPLLGPRQRCRGYLSIPAPTVGRPSSQAEGFERITGPASQQCSTQLHWRTAMLGNRPPHKFEVNYIFQNDPRAQIIEADEESLSQGEAARRLIEHHTADAENSLVMPDVQADETELLRQAEVVGITDIRITRLV